MMKLTARREFQRRVTQGPSGVHTAPAVASHTDSHTACVSPTFFKHITEAGQIIRKEWRYELNVSNTIVDRWLSGEQADPFDRAAKAVGLLLKKGRADLAAMALRRIAGGAEYPGLVLDAAEAEAVRKLAGVK